MKGRQDSGVKMKGVENGRVLYLGMRATEGCELLFQDGSGGSIDTLSVR